MPAMRHQETSLANLGERLLQLANRKSHSRLLVRGLPTAQDNALGAASDDLATAQALLQTAYDMLCAQYAELVETRQAFLAEEQRARELFEAIPDACLVTDLAGSIQEANSAAVALFSLAHPMSGRGRRLASYLSLGERGALAGRLDDLAREGSPGVMEWMMRLPPREHHATRLVRARVVLKRDVAGKAAGLWWLLHDVTDQRTDDADTGSQEPRALPRQDDVTRRFSEIAVNRQSRAGTRPILLTRAARSAIARRSSADSGRRQ